jgi:MYXO-CTERM domain-containing protein
VLGTSTAAAPEQLSTAITELHRPPDAVLDSAAPVGAIATPAAVALLALVLLLTHARRREQP